MEPLKKYLDSRLEFYELKQESYKKLRKLIGYKLPTELEDKIQNIDEIFTDKIYFMATDIITQYEVLEQVWEEKQVEITLQELMISKGKLKREMKKLDDQYEMNVETWMDELLIELDKAGKTNKISKDIAQKAIEIVEQLKIQDYYTKSHAVIIGINDYQNENVLKNAVNDAKAVRNILGFNR